LWLQKDGEARQHGDQAVGAGENQLRDAVADVIGEHLVDQRLVTDMAAARFLSKRFEDARINSNCD